MQVWLKVKMFETIGTQKPPLPCKPQKTKRKLAPGRLCHPKKGTNKSFKTPPFSDVSFSECKSVHEFFECISK